MNPLNLKNNRGIEYESEVKDFIDNIPEGEVFYDLGACVGGFSLYALYKNLKVISFEVDEVNYDGMIENYNNNLKYFNLKHYFESFNIGISDKEGELILRIGQPETGGHWKTLDTPYYSASDKIIKYQNESINYKDRLVKVNSLDNIIKEYNLFPPTYMKIDIDGSEYAFILGAQESLKNCKSLIFELQTDNEYFLEINKILLDLGFKETYRSTHDLGIPNLHNIIYSK